MRSIHPSRETYYAFRRTFGINIKTFQDNMLTVATKSFQFDIIKFDEWLSANDPEYDCDRCTYKGKEKYSLTMYLKEKYGDEANELIDSLNEI